MKKALTSRPWALLCAWLIGAAAAPFWTVAAAEQVLAPKVSIDEIAAGIEAYIAAQTNAGGGAFKIQHNQKALSLSLVRVHLEYLAHLGGGVSFACVDLLGADGQLYDVDFFMKGPAGAMTVTDTTVHKINGQPLYAWEQLPDRSWRRVPVKDAPPRLLGVIKGTDQFDFIYRVKLPRITQPARLWLPLAQSDAFQTVQVEAIIAPQAPREITDAEHGNRLLFLTAGPADGGKTIEVRYHVRRFEKAAYAVKDPLTQRYLKPENLVPLDQSFLSIARQVTRGKDTDLARARALFDHVIEKMRYMKCGSGWGRGDASYACEIGTGNCTDYHAYFIALARAAGIPARFAIGASIPSERDEGGTDGYHCWAEFFADGKWVPVDISEADKSTALADYYFGHHPANRLELSKGRDLVVQPGPVSGPINFLAFPVMEMDGKTVKPRTEFLFQRAGSAGGKGAD